MAVLLLDDPLPGVRRLTLNRPEKSNAMDADMLRALEVAFNPVPGPGPEERVAVIRAEGRVFCSGLDLKDYGIIPNIDGLSVGRIAQRSMRYYSRLVPLMRRMPQPIIAAVKAEGDEAEDGKKK